MKRLAGVAVLSLALIAPVAAQEPGAEPVAESVMQRIDQGLVSAGEMDPPLIPAPAGEISAEIVTIAPDPLLSVPDASLAAPVGPTRLRSTVDTAAIEQRIDKGLTAAGEKSAFEPDYAFGAFQRGYFLTAFSLALDRAEAGDAAAQTLLAELLSRGLGVKQDLPAAADWYSLAGDRGDPEALYALGRFHLEGVAVKADAGKAADLLKRAAKGGHGVAAREFGYLLLQGKGVAKNAMLAAAHLRRAAGQGDMDAQYALGALYVEGVGVVADEGQAARWYGAAARNGHVGAQIEYAILLFNGRGVPRNEAVAARWFREAASADNPLAQMRLSRLLAEGRGVETDPAEAARWYLIASNRGVQDDFMDNWLAGLDPPTRDAAAEAAERWARARGGRVKAASNDAGVAGAVDKQAE
jgi:TPR repeat protein